MIMTANRKISLNGYWDFMPIYDKTEISDIPETVKYEEEKVLVPSSWRSFSGGSDAIDKYNFYPMDVFGYPRKWNDAKCGVLHRTFTYTKNENERIFLKFDAVAQQTTVILNGEKIALWDEGFLPLEIEITNLIKEENELYVLCSEWSTVTIPSGLKKRTALVGSWYGVIMRGIWQDCMLVVRPETYIADYEINTSVRNSTVGITAYIDGDTSELYSIKADIKDQDGNIVKTLTGFGKRKIEAEEEWDDAIYWDTENPYLYTMEITLLDGDTILHTEIFRFGFREFWAEGQNFILNGKRINLRGDSWHFQGAGQQTKQYALNWCRLCKDNGANSIRYHAEPHPEYYLDAADEMGILVVDETAIYGSAKTMDAAHPEFIENCRNHIRRFVKRDKNHASVVIWSLQNEMRWVDGRDEYKKFIPEFMGIFKECDPQKRLISLDGDNRLITKKDTEVASLHYNIDGTINQWDRQHPLTMGEHGGLWYICPQNSSMYLGLKTYQDSDLCADGISEKEQIFMEYARLKEVSGISSFNFAHYFSVPMPTEDIEYEKWDDVTDFGVHPKYIRQYSLTINNGHLKDYPYYIPNSTCKYATEGMRPVTIILSEYNHSFYDDKAITKTLNVFNDTLSDKDVKVTVNITMGDKAVHSEEFSYIGYAGEYYTRAVSFMPPQVEKREAIQFKASIYHNGEHIYTYEKELWIYPASLKTTVVTNEKVYYFGNDSDFEKVKALAPNIARISAFDELKNDIKLLIIGSNINMPSKDEDDCVRKYFADGGKVLLFEQFSYAPGEMTIVKKDFLRADASDYSHPILKDIRPDDLKYWNEKVFEEGPDPFIHSAYDKPVEGNYKVILESSYGDFNDGGDLWSPLMEYNFGCGTVVGCQLDVMKMFDVTPQATVLARNMIEYLANKKAEKKSKTGAIVTDYHKNFLDKIELSYEAYDENTAYDVVIVSASKSECAKGINAKIFILPENENDGESISKLLETNVITKDRPAYVMEADYSFPETKTVSIVDMFGFDKPQMSPRETSNRAVAFSSVYSEGADVLIKSVEGTIWYDLYIENYGAELCKRSLVEYNKRNAKTPEAYYIKKDNVYICRYTVEEGYEKSIRMYTNLLSDLGCEFTVNKMEYVKAEAKNAVEIIMALPYLEYQDFDRAFEYYSDPEFSLNNLGEGLYGWMKKWERDINDGYMKTHSTKGKTMFVTTFVHQLQNPNDKSEHTKKDYKLDLDVNCEYELYINGKLQKDDTVTLLPGINRFFMLAKAKDEDLKFRAVFKNSDGTCADNLLYRVTTDEVDPK